MAQTDTTHVSDKTKDKKHDVTDDASHLSQQALDPKNPDVATAGVKPTDTDKVPKATVTMEGTILFNAYNQKLQDAGMMPEMSTPIGKPDNVKVDAKGHITEVSLPNDQKRSFGYDKHGELNKISEPNGRSYHTDHGKWVDASGKPAPFDKPAVASNGDLVLTAKDGRVITETAEGKTTALNPKDKSVVTYDQNFHVSNVHYANGQSRSFGYDDKGTLNSITETDGKNYTLKDGNWLGPDKSDTYNSGATVKPDGTYSYTKPDGKTVSTSPAGDVSQLNPDGSVARLDANNRISEIDYPDGKKTQFGYDQQGHPNKLVTTDGQTFTLQNGDWRNSKNQDTGISDMRVQPDGSYWFKAGNHEYINSTKDTQSSIDTGSMAKAAQDLKTAKDDTTLFIPTPDKDKIWNVLEPMSPAQRQLVQEQYKIQNPGHDLLTDLKEKLNGPDFARAEALLKRQDGVADTTGQIHQALAKLDEVPPSVDGLYLPQKGYLDDNRIRSEKEIRDSLSTLTADQLKSVEAKYKQDYGHDLMADLQNNNNLSDETKQALQVYAKGNDHRTDEDTLKLANLAITSGRPDIFDEVYRDASQTARDKFINDGGMKKIDDAFGGADAQIAKDYLQRGAVSIATIVNGDTHWYHTNKDDITRAVANATDKDRNDFKRGEEINDKGIKPPYSPEDQRAVDFYTNVDKALHGAGNDRETDKWKAQLRDNEGVISSILDSHNDGGWFGWGAGTDKNKELSAVENMSPKDWQYLHDHPDEVKKIETALGDFDDSHRDQVMQMLHDKLGVKDFAASQQVGNRSIQDRLGDNGDDPSNRVDALAGMTPAEKQQYVANQNGFRDKVNGLLKTDEERALAAHISATKGDISPTDKVLMDGLKNADPNAVFKDIEGAFKADPTLKDRINNPQTADDKNLSTWFHDATHAAVDKAGLGDKYYGDADGGNVVPGDYATFENAIFKDGHVPLDQQLRLTDDKQAKVDLILHSSDADKARLLDQNPDAATKAFQDSVLGTDGNRRDILTYALNQKDAQGNYGYLKPADQFRLYSLDGGSPDNLKQMLSGMTPDQRQDLANDYFTKYHSLVTEDAIPKIPGDQQWRFRELLAPTDIGARQIALDSQMNNDSHTSSWDNFLKNNWDYTRVSADSTQDNMTKFVGDHAAELNKLNPEQRKQFDDAIANYMQAQKAYIDSKGQFAETFVDATLTVAAVGGAMFTGGTSLALLGAIGAGGALYRTAMMASIQGTDFDSSAANILKQSFEGGTQAMLGFIGPEQLGLTMGVRVGTELAEQTALKLVEGSAKALFKDGSEGILKTELANMTRSGAVLGNKEIAALAERVAADGADKNAVEQAIAKQLKYDTMTGLKNIVMREGELYAKNLVAAQVGVQGKELLATALGFESPDTLLDRMKGAAVSTVAGVTMFHGVFRVASSGEYVKVALGRDPAGHPVAGEGTVIKRADGSLEPVVGKDALVELKPGDTISEENVVHDNADGSKDLVEGTRTTRYDSSGKITDISDSANKTKTSIDYVEDPVTHDAIINKITKYNADGTVNPQGSLVRDNGVYYTLDQGGRRINLGTEVAVGQDGTITITGSGKGTEIGRSRFLNDDPTKFIDSITIHTDNTRTMHSADGDMRTIDVAGRNIEIINKYGVKSTFEYPDGITQDPSKITFGDSEWTRKQGKWFDKDGKPFADSIQLSWDGSIKITNPVDTFRTPMEPGKPVESIQIYNDGETSYRYKGAVDAPTDRIEPPQARTPVEILEDRYNSGDLHPQADGTFIHEDPNGVRTTYDAHGDIASVHNTFGEDVDFIRDANGKLTSVEYYSGETHLQSLEVTQSNGHDVWQQKNSAGEITHVFNEVKVDPDGSVTRLEGSNDPAHDWEGTKERPDGLEIKVDTVGRERVSDTALDTERTRVADLSEKGFSTDPARQARFKQWMEDFETTAAKRNPPLTKEEIANTYYQLDKLMSTENSVLPETERLRLAEQFIYKTSNPHTISQGYFGTCNVAAEIENRFMQLHPAEALQMVTDVATTGRFITQDGHIVDMTEMNNVMSPFRSAADGDNAFNPVKYSNTRDYFDQLFQTTAVETYWQTFHTNTIRATSTVADLRAGETFRPGDMRYEFTNTADQRSTGETLNNYSTNPPSRKMRDDSGKTAVDPLTGEIQPVYQEVPAASPNLSGQALLDVGYQISGIHDPPHMLARGGADSAAIKVTSPQNLADQLKQMQQNGAFPATVFVDSRDPLIGSNPNDGGAHVVNVQNIFEKDGKLYVEMTNQYDSTRDYLGDKAIPVEALYKAMEYLPPKRDAIPVEPPTPVQTAPVVRGSTAAIAGGAGYSAYRQQQDRSTDGAPWWDSIQVGQGDPLLDFLGIPQNAAPQGNN